MALSATVQVEVQTGGVDTNGGAFNSAGAGTDYSLVAGKRTGGDVTNISVTDAVAVGTGVITSVTANFTSALVGNVIYLQGGTGALAAGWYQVNTFTSATSITVDRNVAAGTGITMNIGGALLTPGMAAGIGVVTGNKIWIKAGTYTIASATPNIATGCMSFTALVNVEGYNATRGDLGTPPLLQASGITAFTVLAQDTNGQYTFANLNIDCADLATSRGITSRSIVYKCTVSNATGVGAIGGLSSTTTTCQAIGCVATGGAAPGFFECDAYYCVAHTNTNAGFTATSSNEEHVYVGCLAYGNTGATSDGFLLGGLKRCCINCTSYANGRDGFRITATRGAVLINCIAEDNVAGWGFNGVNVSGLVVQTCAGFSNFLGELTFGTGLFTYNVGFITGTGSFFTNAAGGIFTLNNTAGAGAAVRGVGFPALLPYPSGATASYADLGAAQSGAGSPSAGGGVSRARVQRGM